MGGFVFQVGYYFSQVWAGWSFRVAVSVAAGFYAGRLGGDLVLFLIFCFMMAVDLLFGTCLAFKRRRFYRRKFGQWVVKALTHFAVIVIVGFAAQSILGPLGINFPLLDLFLGLLICTEALSILKNMQRLGLPVPKIATRLIADIQDQAEQKAKDFFSRPENDRRHRPRTASEEPMGEAYDE